MDMSSILRAQRDAAIAERDALLEGVTPESYTDELDTRAGELNASIRGFDARIADAEAAEKVAAEARKIANGPDVQVVSEPNPVYRKDNGREVSYFRDLYFSHSDASARERLIQSQERALSTTGTAGGTFAPPAWLVEDYIAYARPARVTADLVQHDVLPGGVSSINLPQVTGGTAVAVVQTQNTGVQNTDMTTSSVSSGITTISGQQVVSLQLLNQSAIPFDRIVLGDLALASASQLDVQVLSGSGSNGQLKGLISAGTTVTFTSTVPAVVSTTAANSFYNKIINAATSVATSRYLPANAIVMHPVRWGWILEALDGQQRPLVTPNGPQFNGLAVTGGVAVQGEAGTLAGLPVYVDPNITQTRGVSTNQDVVYVLRTSDHWLYETAVEQTTWEATYANQNSVLFRANSYAAFLTRYAGSAQIIDGTGLVTPTL